MGRVRRIRRYRGNRGNGFFGILGLFGILGFLLTGCIKPEEPSPSAIYGPLTATGTMSATGASLYRRGTHVLLMDGHSRFFLESRTVDLSRFEKKNARVEGELALNTHPSFLPVLVVTAVTPLEAGTDGADTQRYEVPALQLSLEAPKEWRGTLEDEGLRFRLGETMDPFLQVSVTDTPVPLDGIPLRVAERNGSRVVDDARNRHRVYVEREEGKTILFTFTPDPGHPDLRDAFYSLLHTVRFEEEVTPRESSLPSPSTEPVPSAAEGLGASSAPQGAKEGSSSPPPEPFIPCGGPAHVLCPSGMYCEVREIDTGIGACRTIRSES